MDQDVSTTATTLFMAAKDFFYENYALHLDPYEDSVKSFLQKRVQRKNMVGNSHAWEDPDMIQQAFIWPVTRLRRRAANAADLPTPELMVQAFVRHLIDNFDEEWPYLKGYKGDLPLVVKPSIDEFPEELPHEDDEYGLGRKTGMSNTRNALLILALVVALVIGFTFYLGSFSIGFFASVPVITFGGVVQFAALSLIVAALVWMYTRKVFLSGLVAAVAVFVLLLYWFAADRMAIQQKTLAANVSTGPGPSVPVPGAASPVPSYDPKKVQTELDKSRTELLATAKRIAQERVEVSKQLADMNRKLAEQGRQIAALKTNPPTTTVRVVTQEAKRPVRKTTPARNRPTRSVASKSVIKKGGLKVNPKRDVIVIDMNAPGGPEVRVNTPIRP